MEVLKELRNIEFHDSPVLKLNFDFENKQIELGITEACVERNKTFLFRDVKGVAFQDFIDCTDIEVFDTEFSEINDGYIARFVFLLGFGKPSWTLEFFFKRVEITG